MSGATWKHNELAKDLAAHLRGTSDRLVWTDMQVGPSGSARPDVFTIPKAYSKFRPMAYEVKISVADFRRDVTAGKWQSYLGFSAAVIFAVPRGLIGKTDVPEGCGLIVRTDEGWRNVKGPTLRHIPTLPHEAWMKLLIDGLDRQKSELNIKQGPEWAAERAASKKYGEEIAKVFRDCNTLELSLKTRRDELIKAKSDVDAEITGLQRSRWAREKAQLEAERAHVESARSEFCKALGLDGVDWWRVKDRIAELLDARGADAEVERATKALKFAQRQISEALKFSSASAAERARSQEREVPA